MSEMNPENLTTTDLLKKAMPAHIGNEQSLDNLMRQLRDPGNGKVLHMPGEPKVLRITGPSDREIQLLTIQAIRATMQTLRLLFAAVEGIDLQTRKPDSSIHLNDESSKNELP